MRTRSRLTVFLFICVLSVWFEAGAVELGKQVQFDIPPQSLSSALIQFSKQAEVQVMASGQRLDGVTTKGLRGRRSIEEGLRLLLDDTGLRFRVSGPNTILLGAPPAAPEERLPQGLAPTAAPAGVQAQERILVTARKREESFMDVPSSLAVITGTDIDRRGLVHAEDYLRGIPGVNQVDAPFGQSIVIRGLETSPAFQNFSAGTTVATYFGETPTTNSSGLSGGTNIDIKLVDIERVEVLRGPQGTAFGSSSLGGVVRVIPAEPQLGRFEGRVAAGYSVTADPGGDNHTVQAVANLPLLRDQLALRLVGYEFQDSGYYRNRAASDAAFQTAVVDRFGAQAFARDADEVGDYRVRGGRLSALYRPTRSLRFSVNYLSQKRQADGYALQNSGPYEQTVLQVAPQHVVRGEPAGTSDTNLDLLNAIIEYDFGWANLLFTTSYLKGGSEAANPGTSTTTSGIFAPTSGYTASEHRERVAEIRVNTKLDGPWNFLAGLYAEKQYDDYRADARWQGGPGTNPFGSDFLGGTTQHRTLTQKAAFGEATWNILPSLTATGGIRHYEFDRTQHRVSSGAFFGTSDTTIGTEASGNSFRGNLSYQPTDSALVYADWSQGFRLGKPQAGLSPATCDRNGDGIVDGADLTIESTRNIGSDEVDSYELGGKFTLLDRRLFFAASVYRVDWSGVPVRVVVPSTACNGAGGTYTGNAGTARTEGIELQARFQVTRSFRFDIGASSMRAKLTKDAPGLLPPAAAGARLPGSPKVNANVGLQYELPIAGYPTSFRADATYVGPFYGNLQQSPNSRSGDYVKVDLSARLHIRRLYLDLFVRNATNEDEFTFRDISQAVQFYGYRLRPRTIGIQVGYSF